MNLQFLRYQTPNRLISPLSHAHNMKIIFALILASALLFDAASPPPSPPTESCTDELVAFSPCLGYVSETPNNMTDSATTKCCDAFSKGFDTHESNCFCYLMEQPLIFGFPLNESRVVSLPSACSSLNASFPPNLASLVSLCSARSTVLPPLHSSTGSVISIPFHSGSGDPQSPLTIPLPQSNKTSPVSPSLPPESVPPPPEPVVSTPSPPEPATLSVSLIPPVMQSSSTDHVNGIDWFLLGAFAASLVILAHL